MSTTSTRRQPTDRAAKSGTVRSVYAQHVSAVEETLRTEYATGSRPVTLLHEDAAAERKRVTLMVGAAVFISALAVVGFSLMATMALVGQVNALSWVGLIMIVAAGGLTFVAKRPDTAVAMKEMVGRAVGTQVHTLTATSIEALREAPAALRDAGAPDGVVDAAVSLQARGETHLGLIVTSEDSTSIDTDSVRLLVKDAAKSLALVAIHDQRPEVASKAAVEALAPAPVRKRR